MRDPVRLEALGPFVLCLATACGGESSAPTDDARRELFAQEAIPLLITHVEARACFERRLAWIDPQPGWLLEPAPEQASSSANLQPMDTDPGDTDPGDQGRGGPRIVVGALDDPEVVRLAALAGIESARAGFRHAGTLHAARDAGFVATLLDPENGSCWTAVIAHADPRRCVDLVSAGLLPARPEVRIVGSPARVPESVRVLSFADDDPTTSSEPDLRAYVGAAWKARETVRAWSGKPLAPVELWVHSAPGTFSAATGGSTGSSGAAWVDVASGRAHVLLMKGLASDGGACVAEASARATFGPAAAPWLPHAVGVAASSVRRGARLESAFHALRAAGCDPAAAAVFARQVPFAAAPETLLRARAFWLRGLLEEGVVTGEELWFHAPVAPTVPARFEARQRQVLPRMPLEARELQVSLAGVALAPLSSDQLVRFAAGEELDRVKALGANAVALDVFVSPDPLEPLAAGVPRPAFFARPSDLCLSLVLGAARRRGLRTVLTVQPLASASGTWMDGAVLVDGEDFERFFDRYAVVLEHYALVAEAEGVDVLCVGAELTKACVTVAGPGADEHLRRMCALRAERWDGLLKQTRALFGGALTYAADIHGGELQRVGFWKELDYVGISLFPRFRQEDGVPDAARMRSAFISRLIRASEDAGVARPLLVLQTGFPAAANSAMDFGWPRGAEDEGLQDQAYAELAAALTRARRRGVDLGGVLLWSWAPRDAHVYSPRGRPAEQRLPAIFERP